MLILLSVSDSRLFGIFSTTTSFVFSYLKYWRLLQNKSANESHSWGEHFNNCRIFIGNHTYTHPCTHQKKTKIYINSWELEKWNNDLCLVRPNYLFFGIRFMKNPLKLQNEMNNGWSETVLLMTLCCLMCMVTSFIYEVKTNYYKKLFTKPLTLYYLWYSYWTVWGSGANPLECLSNTLSKWRTCFLITPKNKI